MSVDMYYICAIIATILSIFAAFIYHKLNLPKPTVCVDEVAEEDDVVEEKPTEVKEADEDELGKYLYEHQDSLPGKLQSATIRHKTERMQQRLSDEDRREEAAVRARQIAAIMEVMKGQEEKFGIRTGDDLTDQLKLYS